MCVWKVMVAGVNVHGGYCRKAWCGSCAGNFFLCHLKISHVCEAVDEWVITYVFFAVGDFFSENQSCQLRNIHVCFCWGGGGGGGVIDDCYGCLSEKCERRSRMNSENGVDGIMSRKEFHFPIEVSSSACGQCEIHDGHFWTCIKDHHRIYLLNIIHAYIYIYVIYIHIITIHSKISI